MKKITFNALLNHKAHNYKPMQIEVEKVIPLYGKRFEQMRDHPLDDCPEIIENRDLMYMEGGTAHCIIFLDTNGNDGLLVESDGCGYARKPINALPPHLATASGKPLKIKHCYFSAVNIMQFYT